MVHERRTTRARRPPFKLGASGAAQAMPPQLHVNLDVGRRLVALPPWFEQLWVLEAVYDRVNALRVQGKRTKAQRAAAQAELLPFSAYARCEVAPYVGHDDGEVHVHFSLELARPNRALGGCSDWFCRLDPDFTLFTGLSSWHVYDGAPLVRPAREQWQRTVAWMNGVRPYGWFWLEDQERRACGSEGGGRKRDRAAFQEDFCS